MVFSNSEEWKFILDFVKIISRIGKRVGYLRGKLRIYDT